MYIDYQYCVLIFLDTVHTIITYSTIPFHHETDWRRWGCSAHLSSKSAVMSDYFSAHIIYTCSLLSGRVCLFQWVCMGKTRKNICVTIQESKHSLFTILDHCTFSDVWEAACKLDTNQNLGYNCFKPCLVWHEIVPIMEVCRKYTVKEITLNVSHLCINL